MTIYSQTVEKLKLLSEPSYAEFSSEIANSKKTLLGVRIPMLKRLALDIYTKDCEGYLSECKFEYFEDTMIYGLIISRLGLDEFLRYLPIYLAHADSWSHIDSFVPSIKCIKANGDVFLKLIDNNAKSATGFTLRFYIVCLMDYYLTNEHIDYVLSSLEHFDGKGYYNDMAIAWLISVAFVKFRDKTFKFIKNCKLSDFTLNKSISKIKDSFRVSREDKVLLQNYIRKK